jgi:choline kinase
VTVIGIVLAAGAGRRLHPLTLDLPKTLLPVMDDGSSVLDIALHNLHDAGITDVVVVTGFAAHQIESRVEALQERHGVQLTLVFNDKAEIWNNAYSLWCARAHFAAGFLLLNGDTVHPASVEQTLLANRGPEILLALDDVKQLAEEEMKVVLDDAGRVTRINKALDPTAVSGEYIGVTLVEGSVADKLADALRTTFERDPGLYYEDGFQEFADRGGDILTASIGDVPWVEVDNHEDLAKARGIACLS